MHSQSNCKTHLFLSNTGSMRILDLAGIDILNLNKIFCESWFRDVKVNVFMKPKMERTNRKLKESFEMISWHCCPQGFLARLISAFPKINILKFKLNAC